MVEIKALSAFGTMKSERPECLPEYDDHSNKKSYEYPLSPCRKIPLKAQYENDIYSKEQDSKKKRCSLESEEDKFAAIEAELEELRAFKRAVENKEKDALIDKYHMLSAEEKADVVAHKEEYTLEQIDEKLALIYVRNNVDFSTVDGHPAEEVSESGHDTGLLSFSLDDSSANAGEPVDEIQRSLREMKQF